MVTSGQMESYVVERGYREQTEDWVNGIYERMRETADFLANTDLDVEYKDNPKRLAKLPKVLGLCDIRTINTREDKESDSKWGLFVFEPIPIPEKLAPSPNSFYSSEGILYLFGEDGATVIEEEIDHKKVRKEIKRITTGKSFKGEHLRRIFVMENKFGVPTHILCMSTFRFYQSKELLGLVKETEANSHYDQFGPWYRRL